MKKAFITMLAVVAAVASFAQNPNIGKEIKATKDYKAGLQIYESQAASLADGDKVKAWQELYKLAKAAAEKSFEALVAGKNAEVNNTDVYNALFAAKNYKDVDPKKGGDAMAEIENYRAALINAANDTNDNQEKLNYSTLYIETAKDGDPLVNLASFFAAFANYQNKDYKKAIQYAKSAINDERVKEQAEAIYLASAGMNLNSKADTLQYIEELKNINAEKFFPQICTMYQNIGENETANKLIEEAIQKDPNNKFAFYMRGSAKNESKDFDGAIADYKKVTEIDPSFIYGWYNLALCYGNKADHIQSTKGDRSGRLFGQDLQDCNDAFMGAISNLEKVKELDPDHTEITNWPMQLRMYYNAVGQKAKADEISKMLGDL
jgi:tetratricopeptide (TPR) repeat protein